MYRAMEQLRQLQDRRRAARRGDEFPPTIIDVAADDAAD
jgi:hypothetical protein